MVLLWIVRIIFRSCLSIMLLMHGKIQENELWWIWFDTYKEIFALSVIWASWYIMLERFKSAQNVCQRFSIYPVCIEFAFKSDTNLYISISNIGGWLSNGSSNVTLRRKSYLENRLSYSRRSIQMSMHKCCFGCFTASRLPTTVYVTA